MARLAKLVVVSRDLSRAVKVPGIAATLQAFEEVIPPAREKAVRAEELASLNERLLAWPEGFSLHATLQRTLPRRREALTTGAIDWGHAEALAFAKDVAGRNPHAIRAAKRLYDESWTATLDEGLALLRATPARRIRSACAVAI